MILPYFTDTINYLIDRHLSNNITSSTKHYAVLFKSGYGKSYLKQLERQQFLLWREFSR